jgi:hypothetical protein
MPLQLSRKRLDIRRGVTRQGKGQGYAILTQSKFELEITCNSQANQLILEVFRKDLVRKSGTVVMEKSNRLRKRQPHRSPTIITPNPPAMDSNIRHNIVYTFLGKMTQVISILNLMGTHILPSESGEDLAYKTRLVGDKKLPQLSHSTSKYFQWSDISDSRRIGVKESNIFEK